MKRISFLGILVALLTTCGPTGQLTAQPPLTTLTGPAVLDEGGDRFTSLGASVPENALRTHVRTAIAQLAMFDAVNAVLDGPYRPFASKPVSASGASPEAAAIRAGYIVALNEFPMKTLEIDSAYQMSISRVPASLKRSPAPASRRSMPRKATRGCGAECTGATAPKWVPPSAARSASTPRRIS